MPPPVVALMSDFGTRDHYAGAMKGAVLQVCPEATLVDISHDIPPHDRQGAALQLAAAWRYFPVGTVFLVVVDPGVGSARRALAADTGDYRFVAPDNGVLTAVFKEAPPKRVVELTARRYRRPTVSRTFEGRDLFAPAAAWLANGVQVSALGRPARDLRVLDLPVVEVSQDRVLGEVVHVDRFGNLVTNIDRATAERFASRGAIEITVASQTIGRLVETYSDLLGHEVGALFGSTEYLEIAANATSAAVRLGVAHRAPVRITHVRSNDTL
ncbi:MAG: SAM-dependent chlorinase/fluorinase [Acidobacteria bacterium]|nr:SAM-dependent chlorinase/fluorinase [Acidobacteriota bacterium]